MWIRQGSMRRKECRETRGGLGKCLRWGHGCLCDVWVHHCCERARDRKDTDSYFITHLTSDLDAFHKNQRAPKASPEKC